MASVEDIFMAFKYPGMPKMLVKTMPHGFVLVPFDTLVNKAMRKDYEPWHYAFVNTDKKMYKIYFESYDELVDALFNAKEICYGCYPNDAQPNPLYGKSLELLKIEDDLAKKS